MLLPHTWPFNQTISHCIWVSVNPHLWPSHLPWKINTLYYWVFYPLRGSCLPEPLLHSLQCISCPLSHITNKSFRTIDLHKSRGSRKCSRNLILILSLQFLLKLKLIHTTPIWWCMLLAYSTYGLNVWQNTQFMIYVSDCILMGVHNQAFTITVISSQDTEQLYHHKDSTWWLSERHNVQYL